MSPEVKRSIEARVACSACGAGVGQPCRTVVDNRDSRWVHDARVYADLFKKYVRGKAS